MRILKPYTHTEFEVDISLNINEISITIKGAKQRKEYDNNGVYGFNPVEKTRYIGNGEYITYKVVTFWVARFILRKVLIKALKEKGIKIREVNHYSYS